LGVVRPQALASPTHLRASLFGETLPQCAAKATSRRHGHDAVSALPRAAILCLQGRGPQGRILGPLRATARARSSTRRRIVFGL